MKENLPINKQKMRKKLLILGGSILHCGIVETARQMGIETYVTDYLPLEKSPAKQLADHAWDLNILDCDQIVKRCKEEGIDGVLNAYINPCQLPYQEICEKLNVPCFASKEQYQIFTDKKLFLKTCMENDVDIIPQYHEDDFAFDNPNIEYPLYVKPSDSRGSRGQSVCREYAQMADAIAKAKKESNNNEVVIERFMEDAQDIQLTYFMIDGEPFLECAGDKYNGTAKEGYQGSVIAGFCPSIYETVIRSGAHLKICKMLKKLGLKNTPVFLQGFLEKDKLRLYDPALRLPGFLYEQILREATGLDVYRSMINFALTGSFLPELKELDEKMHMNGKLSVSIWLFVRGGNITKILGIDEIRKESSVLKIEQRYHEGDRIEDWRDIRNNFCEIAALCTDVEEAKELIKKIYDTIHVLDENGKDMIIVTFDPNNIKSAQKE